MKNNQDKWVGMRQNSDVADNGKRQNVVCFL
jgi:hypothetical protein